MFNVMKNKFNILKNKVNLITKNFINSVNYKENINHLKNKRKQFEKREENINKNIKNSTNRVDALNNKIKQSKRQIIFIKESIRDLSQQINNTAKNINEINKNQKLYNNESEEFLQLKNKKNRLLKRKDKLKKDKELKVKNNSLLNNNVIKLNQKFNLISKNIDVSQNNLRKTKEIISNLDDEINELILKSGKEDNKVRRIKSISIIFSPILLFGLYFYGIGRERYYVESDVVVRKSDSSNESINGISGFLGIGNQASREDARFLKIYLESPQILEDISEVLPFKEIYKKKGLDLFSGINKDVSNNKLYRFFKKQINIAYDDISGSINLQTIAYDPVSAFEFNKFLIEKAEEFVNDLNQSIYLRQIDFVNNQVELNFSRLNLAKNKLKEFQNQTKSLNLDQEIISATQLISNLETELAKAKLELSLFERQFVDINAPEIILVRSKISELKKQIEDQRNLLINNDGKNYDQRILTLESLKSNVEFLNNIYNSSLGTSEKIKVDSKKQQRFLAVLSKPIFPEEKYFAWRNKWFFTFTLLILLGYFLTKFILGIVDSHN